MRSHTKHTGTHTHTYTRKHKYIQHRIPLNATECNVSFVYLIDCADKCGKQQN